LESGRLRKRSASRSRLSPLSSFRVAFAARATPTSSSLYTPAHVYAGMSEQSHTELITALHGRWLTATRSHPASFRLVPQVR
jgi:hypothetical protein